MSDQPLRRTGSRPAPDFQHPDQVLALIDEIRDRNRREVERYERYAQRAGELTGEGFSFDGSVRAEVDGDGMVAKIDIPDEALRHGGYLAQMVLGAIREAQAARALKLADLGSELGGAFGVGGALAAVREAVPEHVRETLDARREERR